MTGWWCVCVWGGTHTVLPFIQVVSNTMNNEIAWFHDVY